MSPPSSSTTSAAPWRAPFLSHISHLSPPEFVLSTLAPAPPSSSSTSSSSSNNPPFLPRARTCIFRGMWGSLPPNPHLSPSDPSPNPPVYESDLLALTTDVRMAKVAELFASGPLSGLCREAGHGETREGRGAATEEQEQREERRGSGGGGPVECVFWIRDVQTQWRLRGVAYVLAPDIDTSASSSPSRGAAMAKSVLASRMRVLDADGVADWSWGREIESLFVGLSPGMRGSFRNPEPGMRIVEGDGESGGGGGKMGDGGLGLGLGQKVKGGLGDDATARAHFRVLVVKPDEVERVDLTDPERARRWVYRFAGSRSESESPSESESGERQAEEGKGGKGGKGGIGGWTVEEVWP